MTDQLLASQSAVSAQMVHTRSLGGLFIPPAWSATAPKARPCRSGIAPRQHRHRRSVSTPQMHPRKGQQMIERKAIIGSARAARITTADSRSAYDFVDWAQHQRDLLLQRHNKIGVHIEIEPSVDRISRSLNRHGAKELRPSTTKPAPEDRPASASDGVSTRYQVNQQQSP